MTGRYLDPSQSGPEQHRNVLDAFVRPPEVASTQLQIPEAAPEMILQPNAPVVDHVDHSRHSPEIQSRRKDAEEVEWEDLAPHPTDQIKRYVGGRTS